MMMLLKTTLVLLLATCTTASTVQPPVVPLIVRNPYLSTWIRAREAPWTQWPIFWTGQQIGMSLMVAVPKSKTVYPLLGRPQDSLAVNGRTDGYLLHLPHMINSD